MVFDSMTEENSVSAHLKVIRYSPLFVSKKRDAEPPREKSSKSNTGSEDRSKIKTG